MKRFVSLILSGCLAFNLSSVAFAQDNADIDTQSSNIMSLEDIIDFWIEENYEGDVSTSKIVRLFDPNDVSGQCIGHLVSFEKDNTPAGYIVLSREEEGSPVIEFALSGESVYDRLENQFATYADNVGMFCCDDLSVDTSSPYSIINDDVLYTDFLDYSITIANDEDVLLFDQYCQLHSFSDFSANTISTLSTNGADDGYYNVPDETGSVRIGVIPGAYDDCGLLMSQFASSENNCGPTALTNIVNLYANYALDDHAALPKLKTNGSDKDTYRLLAQFSGYKASNPPSLANLVKGLDHYCNEINYTCSYGHYWLNLWSDYTRDIGKNLPILLHTARNDGLSHDQVVVGYKEYTSVSSSSTKYLMVYTGWTTNMTYVKFKANCFTSFDGYVVEIS